MQNSAPITTAEAAAILGVSAMTVRRRIESGEIACIRKLPGPNGDFLIDPAEIERAAKLAQVPDGATP